MISEKEADKLHILIEELIRAICECDRCHRSSAAELDNYILSLTKIGEPPDEVA